MVTVALSKVSPEDLAYQNAHYDDNQGPVVLIVTSIFYALALVLVLLRFLTKTVRKLNYHAGDYLMIAAMVLVTALWIQGILSVKWGAGKHILRVYREHGSAEFISRGLQVLFAIVATYNCAHLAIKLSILFLYRHIFTLVIDWFRRAWYCVLCYVVVTFIVLMVLLLTQCRPISHLWNEIKGTPGECGNLQTMAIANSIITAMADFLLLVLPLPVLWSLRRPMRERIMLCGLFALGSLTLVASIVRIVYIARVTSSVDFTYMQVNMLIWSMIEVDTGIICACIPTLKPLFAQKPARQSYSSRSLSQGLSASSNSRTQAGTGKKPLASLDDYPLTNLEG